MINTFSHLSSLAHDTGLVTLQVAISNQIISNSVVFEYKARALPSLPSSQHDWLSLDGMSALCLFLFLFFLLVFCSVGFCEFAFLCCSYLTFSLFSVPVYSFPSVTLAPLIAAGLVFLVLLFLYLLIFLGNIFRHFTSKGSD